jgi:hypothetical protein
VTKKRKPPKKRFGLSKRHTYKYARDFLDFDYLDELAAKDPKALEWLRKFSAEYYQNTFVRNGRDLQDDEKRRACYRATNERQRDVWNQFSREFDDEEELAKQQEEDEQ